MSFELVIIVTGSRSFEHKPGMRAYVEDTLHDRVLIHGWKRRSLLIHGKAKGPDDWSELPAIGLGYAVHRYLPNGVVTMRSADGRESSGRWIKNVPDNYYAPLDRNKVEINVGHKYAVLGIPVFVAGFIDTESKTFGTGQTLQYAAEKGLWHYDFIGGRYFTPDRQSVRSKGP